MKFYFLIIILLLSIFTLGQKFSISQMKTEKVQGANKSLIKVLDTNDERKIYRYLLKNKDEINDGVSRNAPNNSLLNRKFIAKPLLWELTEKQLNNEISFDLLAKVIALNPNLEVDYQDKNYLYYLLDILATNKSQKVSSIENILNLLVANNYDINKTYKGNPPPLTYLLFRNYNHLNGSLSDEYLSNSVLKLLIENGANVNAVDKYGNNLITFAINNQRTELSNYLLNKGINMENKNKSNKDSFIFAIQNGNLKLVKAMIEKNYPTNLSYLYNNGILSSLKIFPEIEKYLFSVTKHKRLNLSESIGFIGLFPKRIDSWFNKYLMKETDFRPDSLVTILSFIDDNNIYMETDKVKRLKRDYVFSCSNLKDLVAKSKTVNYTLDFEVPSKYYQTASKSDKLLENLKNSSVLTPNLIMDFIDEIEHKTKNYRETLLASKNFDKIREAEKSFPKYEQAARDALLELLLSYKSNIVSGVRYSAWNPINSLQMYKLEFWKYIKELNIYIEVYNNEDEQINELLSTAKKKYKWIEDEMNYIEQQRRRDAQIARQRSCDRCRLDNEATTFPYKKDGFFGTEDVAGKIVMENGEKYEYYYDNDGYSLRDGFLFFSDKKFDSFDEMLEYFINTCRQNYCD